jgi:hypothetical protein
VDEKLKEGAAAITGGNDDEEGGEAVGGREGALGKVSGSGS